MEAQAADRVREFALGFVPLYVACGAMEAAGEQRMKMLREQEVMMCERAGEICMSEEREVGNAERREVVEREVEEMQRAVEEGRREVKDKTKMVRRGIAMRGKLRETVKMRKQHLRELVGEEGKVS